MFFLSFDVYLTFSVIFQLFIEMYHSTILVSKEEDLQDIKD